MYKCAETVNVVIMIKQCAFKHDKESIMIVNRPANHPLPYRIPSAFKIRNYGSKILGKACKITERSVTTEESICQNPL